MSQHLPKHFRFFTLIFLRPSTISPLRNEQTTTCMLMLTTSVDVVTPPILFPCMMSEDQRVSSFYVLFTQLSPA
jgi:hypothetical protein